MINGEQWAQINCTRCDHEWTVELANASITSNYYRHYKRAHKHVDAKAELAVAPKDDLPTSDNPRKILDYWAVNQQANKSFVRTKGQPFKLETFLRLVIQFLVCNALSINLVTSTSFRHLTQYLSGFDIVLNTRQIIRHMIIFYKECQLRQRDRFRLHIADGSRICLTTDGWAAPNGDSYMVVTAHWIDDNWVTHGLLIEFAQLPPSHTSKFLRSGRLQQINVVQVRVW